MLTNHIDLTLITSTWLLSLITWYDRAFGANICSEKLVYLPAAEFHMSVPAYPSFMLYALPLCI